jgi:hypothetical protein|nr:MAG TPA: hypothetical protein [Caudoviricetes sp.]
MMDNATFRANMENAVNAAHVKCSMPTQEPGIHDLLARLGELAKENRGLSYQIRDNLFGPIPTNGDSCEKAIGCAKDAIEDAIARLVEANDILRYIVNHL